MGYLTMEPILLGDAHFMALGIFQGSHGALVTFAGIVRGDGSQGRSVHALFYEAHIEMAERQIERLILQAKAQWPEVEIVVRHRLGRVEVGQVSLFIGVAAPHRSEAYAASRFTMEGIKHHVPVWKQEHYTDGTSQWVGSVEEGLHVGV